MHSYLLNDCILHCVQLINATMCLIVLCVHLPEISQRHLSSKRGVDMAPPLLQHFNLVFNIPYFSGNFFRSRHQISLVMRFVYCILCFVYL